MRLAWFGGGAALVLTFDRYILRSFLHVFSVCVIAMFGLVVIIDLLDHLDDFLTRTGDRGTFALLARIGEYYGYQSIFFFDRAGPALLLVAVMVVLILFQRSGELHPVLAAGVPMYRVLLPLVGAASVLSGLFVVNQEWVIPQIAHAAYEGHGGNEGLNFDVESFIDHATRISIDGKSVRMAERAIDDAEFALPAPALAHQLTILKAKRAVQCPATEDRPAGWRLEGVTPRWRELELTEAGLTMVLPGDRDDAMFVATAVTCEQLYKRSSSFTKLSTRELMDRVHSPAYGAEFVHRFVVHLHGRFLQPVLNVIAVLLVLPLMVRRESPGLVVDAAVCFVALGALFGAVQGCAALAQSRLIAPDLAAWLPVIFGGSLSAWLSAWIRT